MKNITKSVYKSLCDFPEVYKFMVDNYAVNWKNGSPAPYFEYAQVHILIDGSQSHRNAIWRDNGKMVAFAFYEMELGQAQFNLSEGYEFLIPDMIKHAEERLRDKEGVLKLLLFSTQTAIINEASRQGYKKEWEWEESVYDYAKAPLDYALPEGYSFEEGENIDIEKMTKATWRGFDHDDEPPGFESHLHLRAAPYANPELDLVVKNQAGEYVCCAKMWFVKENKLAYLEPLSTVPEERGKGLAAALISEMYRKTSTLGATHMTGGDNKFYFKLGFEEVCKFTIWRKRD